MNDRTIFRHAPLLCFFIFLVSGSIEARAQADRTSTQFSCLIWKQLPFKEIFYRDGDKIFPLELYLNNRSSLYPISSSAEKLQLVVQKEQSGGQMGLEIVGEVPMVPNTKRMLFVIQAAEKGAKYPLQIFGLDDSEKNFPVGSFRFLNFTKSPLYMKFNGSEDGIKPMGMTVVKSRVQDGGGFLPFVIRMMDGKKVFETRLYSQAHGREIVFIGPPPNGSDRLTIKFLSEVIPPPKTASKN